MASIQNVSSHRSSDDNGCPSDHEKPDTKSDGLARIAFSLHGQAQAQAGLDTGDRMHACSVREAETYDGAAMLCRFLLLICGLSTILATGLKAQWEKLPLYSGHADYLIQNKYKQNEVFAVVKRGGIYRSTNYGKSWHAIVDEKEKYGWVTEISDFEVVEDGSYFVYANSALWKSTDSGQTWVTISEKFPSGYANIEAHNDGTIFLLITDDNPYILRSSDYGEKWDTLRLRFQDSYRMRNYVVNPVNSDMILLYGSQGACRICVDGGHNWKDIQFAHWGALENPIIYKRNAVDVLGIWWLSPPEYMYYESLDTGKTWEKINITTIIYPDSYSTDNKSYYDSSGLMLKTIMNNIYISKDYGKNVIRIQDLIGWDIVKPDIHTQASVLLDGLYESPDTGSTWKSFKGSRQFPGYFGVDVSFLSEDTMFALTRELYYYDGKPRWACLLMQSNDGGSRWFDLHATESMDALRTISSAESNYFFISKSNVLVRGKPGHSPDTLLTTVGAMIGLDISKPYPTDMYVVVNQNGGFSYFFTTNGGDSWSRAPVPPYLYDQVAIYPSLVERGKFFAVTHSPNPLDIDGLGLWVVRNYGERWELTLPTPDLLGFHVCITERDRVFNASNNTFSTDDGRTWFTDTTGFEGSDWSEFKSKEYSKYTTSKGLVIANERFWYVYRNNGWTKLRDVTGSPISRTPPSTMDFSGRFLYCARAFNGLYRIAVSMSTIVQTPIEMTEHDELVSYPNPFTGRTTISYRLADIKDVVIRLTNPLGETILVRELTEKIGEFSWEGRNASGTAFSSGIYYAIVYRTGAPVRYIPLIIIN